MSDDFMPCSKCQTKKNHWIIYGCARGDCEFNEQNRLAPRIPLPNVKATVGVVSEDAKIQCSQRLRYEHKPYPRTCEKCGIGPCRESPNFPGTAAEDFTGASVQVGEGTKYAEPVYRHDFVGYKDKEIGGEGETKPVKITKDDALVMLFEAVQKVQVSALKGADIEDFSREVGKLHAVIFRLIQEGYLDWYQIHTAEQAEGIRLLKIFHPVMPLRP